MLGDLLIGTLRSLRAHALRVFLTSMGIVWGTAMLTVLRAYSDGYHRHFQHEIDKVGPRIVWTFPGVKVKDHVGERGARPVELEVEDAQRVAALASVEAAAPDLWVGPTITRFGRTTKLIWTYGATEATRTIRTMEVAEGRFIDAADVTEAARVVYLGHVAARRVFGRRPAVGRTVQLEGIPFRVIGVGLEKGDQIVNMGPKDDELALIPVTTAQRRFLHHDRVDRFVFAPTTREGTAEATRHMRQVLALIHGFHPEDERALSVFDIQMAAGLVQGLGLGVSIFLTTAGVLTLLVGAVGVMNIMLVVVSERTREVGLRKAVGASNRDIFTQFLAEAAVLTTAAGAVGGLLGWLAVGAMARALPADNPLTPHPYLEPTTAVWIALALVAVGVASGVIPALRASRIEPAISLRSL